MSKSKLSIRSAGLLAIFLYLSLRYNAQMKLFIHQVGPRLRKVALVRKQAASAKAARAADLVNIFGPFWIQLTIRLF
jgi:hypothetical protein